MLIRHRRSWELPESAATEESVFWNRRRVLQAAGMGGVLLAGGWSGGALAQESILGSGLYPAERNPAYTLDRPLTAEALATTYNNFFEFGSQKNIHKRAQDLVVSPWDIQITGDVEIPQTLSFDDLLKRVDLEERLYRHRCVETWSMAVPWTGFPLKALVDMAAPLSGAKYLRMETFHDPEMAVGQKAGWYPWPYVEGLTIEEATNEMAFLVTGVYGKPLPKQMGAPLRLAVPWKYGFKSIKSIVKFEFTSQRPRSFWQATGPREYGFWANVNPAVPHRRWSQATEKLLGSDERIPTLLYNGYAEQVAHLYKGLEKEPLYM